MRYKITIERLILKNTLINGLIWPFFENKSWGVKP